MGKNIKSTLQILHFQSQGVHFCIDLNYISKVFPLMAIEPIPGSPHYVAGLMNLAGHSIPVIDFIMSIGLKRNKHYSLDTPILYCKNENHELGMIVDSVIGLDFINEAAIQMQDQFNDTNSPFIGTVVLNNDITLFINMGEILKTNLVRVNPNFYIDNNLINKMGI